MTKNQWLASQVRLYRRAKPGMRISRAQQIAKRFFANREMITDYYDRLRLLHNRPPRVLRPVFMQQLFGDSCAVSLFKIKHGYSNLSPNQLWCS